MIREFKLVMLSFMPVSHIISVLICCVSRFGNTVYNVCALILLMSMHTIAMMNALVYNKIFVTIILYIARLSSAIQYQE